MNVAVPAAVRAAAATSPPPIPRSRWAGETYTCSTSAAPSPCVPKHDEADRGARGVAGQQRARAAQRGDRVLVLGEAAVPRSRPAPTAPSATTRPAAARWRRTAPRRSPAPPEAGRRAASMPAARSPSRARRSAGRRRAPAGLVLDLDLAVLQVALQDVRGAHERVGGHAGVRALDAQAVVVPERRQPRAADGSAVLPRLDDVAEPGVLTVAPGDRPRGGRRRQSSSSSSLPPARRITIWSSSIVISTGRWPAQCSA